jgi:CubicO group peptidase (beta-lactamase class C family)
VHLQLVFRQVWMTPAETVATCVAALVAAGRVATEADVAALGPKYSSLYAALMSGGAAGRVRAGEVR